MGNGAQGPEKHWAEERNTGFLSLEHLTLGLSLIPMLRDFEFGREKIHLTSYLGSPASQRSASLLGRSSLICSEH